MCHTVTRDPRHPSRDAPVPLGRPGRRRAAAGADPRAGRPGLRDHVEPGRGGRGPAAVAPRPVRAGVAAGGARRRRRAGRRRNPTAADPRQVDSGPAARPLRRPRRRPRRGGPPGRRGPGRPRARGGGPPPPRRGPVRWRNRRDRRPGRPARRLRGCAQPGPRADGPTAGGRPGLDDGDPRAGAARPGGGDAPRRARPDARALPPVVRVRLDRRLRRDPLVGSVLGRLRPLRRDGRRSHGRDPDRHPEPRAPHPPRPPDRTCARCCSARRVPSGSSPR